PLRRRDGTCVRFKRTHSSIFTLQEKRPDRYVITSGSVGRWLVHTQARGSANSGSQGPARQSGNRALRQCNAPRRAFMTYRAVTKTFTRVNTKESRESPLRRRGGITPSG